MLPADIEDIAPFRSKHHALKCIGCEGDHSMQGSSFDNDTYLDHLSAVVLDLRNGETDSADRLAEATVRQLQAQYSAAIVASLLAQTSDANKAWEDFVPFYLLPVLSKAAQTNLDLAEPFGTLLQTAASQCSPRDLGVIVLAEWSALSEHSRWEPLWLRSYLLLG